MQIDDFLDMPKFKELNDILTAEMWKYMTPTLVEKMNSRFDNDEQKIRHWFYSPVMAFNYKRPYDLCKAGKSSDVEDLLCRLEWGVFS